MWLPTFQAGTSGIRPVTEVGQIARAPDEGVVGVEGGEAQRHTEAALHREQRLSKSLDGLGSVYWRKPASGLGYCVTS